MDRWITYIKERFPLHTFAVLVGGISLSGMYLYGKPFQILPFILSFVGILLFFGLLRLMDEIKDFDKDSIAHPDRPLPRGLIKKAEAIYIVNVMLPILVAYSMIVWVVVNEVAALAYLCIVIYLWLMYREFFWGDSLNRRPLLYGISHQLVVFPVVFFAIAVNNPHEVLFGPSWSFAAMVLGAFFCYEICRKLDPHAHPVLATYVHFYGFRRTFEIAAIAIAISAMGAAALNLWPLLLPCELVVFLSLVVILFQPAWFRIPEILASISLILHVWAVVIFQVLR